MESEDTMGGSEYNSYEGRADRPGEIEQVDLSTVTGSLSPAPQVSLRSPLDPRSLGALLALLSQQYFQVLGWPSPATFAAQHGKASWRAVWVQVLGWASLSALLAYVARLLSPGPVTIMGAPALGLHALQGQPSPTEVAIGVLLGVPLVFLLWMGLVYILARATGGQGTFLTQLSTTLLFQVPLGLLSSLLLLLPFCEGLCLVVLGYGLFLHVFMVMAVHHLNGSKATAIIFLPVLLVVVPLITFTLTFVGGVLLLCLLGAYLLLLWEVS
jgi:hypothetical protein